MYANTLGYIYYYGRCNDGTPEYEKAFRYFSFGAANGLYESIYKLSDMYRNGYGVWKSEETAFNLVAMLYQDLRPKYEHGEADDQFADVALRMGSMMLYGIGTEKDPETAMDFLMQADYAIRERMDRHYYGDNVVAANIQKALAEAKQQVKPEKNTGRFLIPFYAPVQMLLREDYRISWQAKRLKDGDWSVTFRRVPKQDEREVAKTFMTLPQIAYCEFTDTVKGHVTSAFGLMQPEGRADAIEFAKDENNDKFTILYYDHQPVLKLVGTVFEWVIKKPAKRSGKTVRIVSVTFSQSGREYDYLCDMEDIKPGDKVIVNGYNGLTEVEVQRVSIVPACDLALPLDRYKRIEKRARAGEDAEASDK